MGSVWPHILRVAAKSNGRAQGRCGRKTYFDRCTSATRRPLNVSAIADEEEGRLGCLLHNGIVQQCHAVGQGRFDVFGRRGVGWMGWFSI